MVPFSLLVLSFIYFIYHVIARECPFSESQKIELILKEKVFDWARDEFKIEISEIPEECELLPWKDANYEHNSLRNVDGYQKHTPRCRQCQKMFKSSEYLDRHIEERHQPVSKHPGNCLSRFCSFLPCHSSTTLINKLHEHHPERTRLTLSCRQVIAKCFPPLKSSKFKDAHGAMESHFCEGQFRNSGNHQKTLKGYPISMILSYIFVAAVLIYYIAYLILQRQDSISLSHQGLRRLPKPRPLSTIGIKPVVINTPPRRKYAGSELSRIVEAPKPANDV